MTFRRNRGGAWAALVALAIFAAEAPAASLLNDTWADGDRTSVGLPSNSPTYVGVSGTSVPPSSVNVTPGQLSLVQGSSSSKIWTYFTSDNSAPDGNQPHNAVTQLQVNDRLTTSMTFTFPNAVTNNAGSAGRDFRFGVFFDPTDARVQVDVNSDGGGGTSPWQDATGYVVQIPLNSNPTNTTAPFQIGKRTTNNTSLAGSGGAYTLAPSGGTPLVVTEDISYTAEMIFDVVSANQLDVTTRWLQGNTLLSSHTVSDTGTAFGGTAVAAGLLPGSQGIYTNFDQLFFRYSSNVETGQIDFTNFKVELTQIPEPASLALIGLSSLALLRRRGR